DDEIISKLGLPREIFQPIRMPGQALGPFTAEIRDAVGFDCTVLLPATHDTASALVAVPARDDKAVYPSSGSGSLLGVEYPPPITTPESCAANFTNEGVYESRYRYLNNIMGLWMIQSVRRELGEEAGARRTFPELIAAAQACSDFPGVVSTGDDRFLAPKSMIEEVNAACTEAGYPTPETTGDVMQVIYNSLPPDCPRATAEPQALTSK